MKKVQVKKDDYIIYGPDSLKRIINDTIGILDKKVIEYKKLFDSDFRPFVVNYFDDINKFHNFLRSLGDNDFPDYCQGTFDEGMVNGYIDSNLIVDSPKYKDRLYTPSHELFHIMYLELVLKGDSSKRSVWYDEGMAQFYSGEKDYLDNPEEFKNYFDKVRKITKTIPDLNKVSHENGFVTDDYNGYDLSYLAVRYLSETLSEEEFKRLLFNPQLIEGYGKDIVNKMFSYYDELLNKEKTR